MQPVEQGLFDKGAGGVALRSQPRAQAGGAGNFDGPGQGIEVIDPA